MATWKELLEAKKLASQPKADSSLINSAWDQPAKPMAPVSLTLAERLAAIKSKKNPLSVEKPSTLIVSISSAEKPLEKPLEKLEEKGEKKESFSLNVEYDEDQLNAIALAKSGKSFVLIGAAGSGKTTVERGIMLALLAEMKETETHDFRIQGTSGRSVGPAIAIAAPTRIASGNSRKAICKDAMLAEKCFYLPDFRMRNCNSYIP